MLLTRVRVRPCRERESRSSSGLVTDSVPSASLETVIGSTTSWLRAPLGPLTCTVAPSMSTLTPAGTVIGSLPIRDMTDPLPDVGEDFPAHLLLGGLPIGQQPVRRRDDGDAQAAEHPRELGRLGVDPKAGLADALDAGQRALAARA